MVQASTKFTSLSGLRLKIFRRKRVLWKIYTYDSVRIGYSLYWKWLAIVDTHTRSQTPHCYGRSDTVFHLSFWRRFYFNVSCFTR